MFYGANNQQAPMMNWYGNQQSTNVNPQNYGQPTPGYFPQRPPQPSMLPGKVVTRLEEITPSDVPMDGSMSLFPLSDGSCIIGRLWSNDGTIKTVRYGLINEQETKEEPKPDYTSEILTRLDAIEKLLNRKPENNKKGGDDHAIS